MCCCCCFCYYYYIFLGGRSGWAGDLFVLSNLVRKVEHRGHLDLEVSAWASYRVQQGYQGLFLRHSVMWTAPRPRPRTCAGETDGLEQGAVLVGNLPSPSSA